MVPHQHLFFESGEIQCGGQHSFLIPHGRTYIRDQDLYALFKWIVLCGCNLDLKLYFYCWFAH
jgi:hypothetical protein